MVIRTEQLIPELSVVNNETGEIVSGVAKINCKTQEEFIMVFLNSLNELLNLSGFELRVLMVCWKESTFSAADPKFNYVYNSKMFKEKVREVCPGMSDGVIDNAFTRLRQRNLLIRVCRGVYRLNSTYFFRGNLANRSKLMAQIIYNPEDNNPPTSAADQ